MTNDILCESCGLVLIGHIGSYKHDKVLAYKRNDGVSLEYRTTSGEPIDSAALCLACYGPDLHL